MLVKGLSIILGGIMAIIGGLMLWSRMRRKSKVVGFFHPFANDMAGGERVLWLAPVAVQEKHPELDCVVYVARTEGLSWETIQERAQSRFNVRLKQKVGCVWLTQQRWVQPAPYPRLTILGQSLGSVWLCLEALFTLVPKYLVDTTGYGFTYPVWKYMGGCVVSSYTHYPTVSTDMLGMVESGRASYNNNAAIAGSRVLSRLKG